MPIALDLQSINKYLISFFSPWMSRIKLTIYSDDGRIVNNILFEGLLSGYYNFLGMALIIEAVRSSQVFILLTSPENMHY